MTFNSESEHSNLAKRHFKAKMFSIFCGAVTVECVAAGSFAFSGVCRWVPMVGLAIYRQFPIALPGRPALNLRSLGRYG